MICLKSTERSAVHATFDGSVQKRYLGSHARQRLENEVRILSYLELRECPFVPRLLKVDRSTMEIVVTNCGYPVQSVTESKIKELFGSLRAYGVEHGDPEMRNITYRSMDGRFCIVDFEYAEILDDRWCDELDALQQQIDSELSQS